MTPFEVVVRWNSSFLRGESLPEEERLASVHVLLQAVCDPETVRQFYRKGGAADGEERYRYPLFYVPPSDKGKKHVTLTRVTPRSHLFSANAYELEILGLLAILGRENELVHEMLSKTKERLSRTCFGRFCEDGECFETSIHVLRFWGRAFPDEMASLEKLLHGIKAHMGDRSRHSGTAFYYRLALSELPLDLVQSEIRSSQNELLRQLGKSYVMNSENDRYVNVMAKYILRNVLSRLPEYEYLKNREPYLSESDGRLHVDVYPLEYR
ncbi:hypothetical protein [Gorillibacterium sp. CAU 1737]|uniref:hypothetical protein n=1 Tax=Gorillibacterium sp. CAU 1737 TaxID=3140362 RepID=UPI003261B529